MSETLTSFSSLSLRTTGGRDVLCPRMPQRTRLPEIFENRNTEYVRATTENTRVHHVNKNTIVTPTRTHGNTLPRHTLWAADSFLLKADTGYASTAAEHCSVMAFGMRPAEVATRWW